MLNSSIAHYRSPIGLLKVQSTQRAITSIKFIEDDSSKDFSSDLFFILTKCLTQLDEYFRGDRKVFTIPISTTNGTPFQKKVWKELTNIAFGQIISYKELASKLGDSKAAHAVGLAISKNPITIIIPCHRVIGSNKSLTGYTGGVWRKRWLLKHEINDINTKDL